MRNEFNTEPTTFEVKRMRTEIAGLRFINALQTFRLALTKFDPDQPRVPGGQTGGGQWTSVTDEEAGDGRRDPLLEDVRMPGGAGGASGTLTALGAVFLELSKRNSPDQTAILEFNARAYAASDSRDVAPPFVSVLTREQTDATCPRHTEVQEATSRIAAEEKEKGYFTSARDYGTLVHKRLADEINGRGGYDSTQNPDFRAEYSVIKSREADHYGARSSIRVDVLERVGDGTVCVYDIKTGKSRRSASRMAEIAFNVNTVYPGTQRVVVIETRPR